MHIQPHSPYPESCVAARQQLGIILLQNFPSQMFDSVLHIQHY